MPLLIAGSAAVVAPAVAAAAARTGPGLSAAHPAARFSGNLHGVAATSAHNAWAVGSTGTTHLKTLLVHWNGKAWRQVPSPGGGLSGVAVVSERDAWAVGSTGRGKTLIVHWNGTAWRQVASPSPGEVRQLTVGRDRCLRGHRMGSRLHVQGWQHRRRNQEPDPAVERQRLEAGVDAGPVLGKVRVRAARRGTEAAATAHWNGRGWTLSPGRSGAELSGVAGISASDAWAVAAPLAGTR